MKLVIQFFYVIFHLINAGSAEDCTLPPALWCDSPETQKRCDAVEQCRKYEKAVYDRPVKVTLLYEAMCRGCRNYISQTLFPTWQNLKAIMDVELVPFGNANVTLDGGKLKLVCQHGEKDCSMMTLQACTIDKLKSNPEVYMPLLVCLDKEVDLAHNEVTAMKNCFSEQSISIESQKMISECRTSSVGQELMAQMANKTKSAWPMRHQGVPWVLINNAGTVQSQGFVSNLGSYICQHVFRGIKPEACKQYEKNKRCCF